MHTLRPFDSSGCFWLLSATLTFLVSTGKLNLYEEWIQTSKSRIENVVLLRHIKVGSPETQDADAIYLFQMIRINTFKIKTSNHLTDV